MSRAVEIRTNIGQLLALSTFMENDIIYKLSDGNNQDMVGVV